MKSTVKGKLSKQVQLSDYIEIRGARENNLKNIDIKIERGKFTVFTGLSGSGKSSLAFDTLYSEGQRRYVESLSSYARQFLGRLNKPDVDFIEGIPPAIAVEQKVNTSNPRSTVGTSTEIYDYLKLLYARAGDTYSPVSGKKVTRHSVTDAVNYFSSLDKGKKLMILAPLHVNSKRSCTEQLNILKKQGFSRVEFDGEIHKIEKLLTDNNFKKPQKPYIIIDRLKTGTNEDTLSRVADSVQTAFYEGRGVCTIKLFEKGRITIKEFSDKFSADGIEFEEPIIHTFDFNSPAGACPTCKGFGKTMGIDENLVIPNKSLSIYEEAVAPWKGQKMSYYKDRFISKAHLFDFPIHKPYFELSEKNKTDLWDGNKHLDGLYAFFDMIKGKSRKIQYRVMLSRYRGKTTCHTCKGKRLKKEAGYVKISGKSISDLVDLPIDKLKPFFDNLVLDETKTQISKRILEEIRSRLKHLTDTGLTYLTLNRLSSSLSGGESQRINIASSLGSSLVGSLYILDEPSIGLHPRDNHLLIKVMKDLRDIGNTVIVVEHDEEIIKAADEIKDIGPKAGSHGGELIYEGKYNPKSNTLSPKAKNSMTAQYLTGEKEIPLPKKRRKPKGFISLKGATRNNLKNIDVDFPLGVLTVVTGVSGSGKSTLVRDEFYPSLQREIDSQFYGQSKAIQLSGDIDKVEQIEFVSQNPIGKSSRSNPATYIKVYDDIRKLYAGLQKSKINNYKPGHFSFNVEGGRCETCKGEGEITVEMQFMADVKLVCEECKGKRFKDDILDVRFKGKNISDILDLTAEDAFEFFSTSKSTKHIAEQLQPLIDVGLSYLSLGQSSNTLSGGESQRIKLASFLKKERTEKAMLFIFDEPTTGLHLHDINRLLTALNALIANGHTVLIIEHNLDLIKTADYIIDLGPEGGDKGGKLVFSGKPEDLIDVKESYTAKYLKEKLMNENSELKIKN
ncbi:MAG: excinuclease ABC subunit UvrA [Bacteroidota bacterium]|nr:excinuclease ABC subunit UvrA [Bacteroidota bacterium]